ncbi:hypothetical protein [Pseudomonas sp. Irchel 3A18]|uniref:hypothetical protein n=1 Tax=Pseudomonas sp. Irchel 3A18 TaxID=2008905 RepID=UPI000BA43379
MTGISLDLPEDLSNSLCELAKTNGQTVSYLAMDVLRDYIGTTEWPAFRGFWECHLAFAYENLDGQLVIRGL